MNVTVDNTEYNVGDTITIDNIYNYGDSNVTFPPFKGNIIHIDGEKIAIFDHGIFNFQVSDLGRANIKKVP